MSEEGREISSSSATSSDRESESRTALERVKTYALRDLAFSALQRAIMRGEFSPGQQLDLPEIARSLGVSMTPLKEAVSLLERYGLVDIRPRKGTSLRLLTPSDLHKRGEARIALEVWAAGHFPERALPDDRLELRKAHGELADALAAILAPRRYRADTTERWAELDFAYHRKIIATARNDYMLRAYEALATPLITARTSLLMPEEVAKASSAASQRQHGVLLRALESGDVKKAQACIVAHVESGVRAAEAALESYGGVI